MAIPTIPGRERLLARAVASVRAQSRPVDALSVVLDVGGLGATDTRNRAWQTLSTDYVAFLDDDDEFGVHHIDMLLDCALTEGAAMVFPWFTVRGGTDPFPFYFGVPWDPEAPHQTTVTCLWRRSALDAIGGFPDPGSALDTQGNRVGEDYLAVLALNAAGGRIVHLAARTWTWSHWHGNTSGLPTTPSSPRLRPEAVSGRTRPVRAV